MKCTSLMPHMLTVATILLASSAYASSLTYKPTNPAFGGNPLNSTHLQFQANSNNQHQNDGQVTTRDSVSDLINRAVTFELANRINDELFNGTDPTGNFLLGDGTSISYVRNGSTIEVTFIGVDGSSSTFIVPV